jgi:hypothetical protein
VVRRSPSFNAAVPPIICDTQAMVRSPIRETGTDSIRPPLGSYSIQADLPSQVIFTRCPVVRL